MTMQNNEHGVMNPSRPLLTAWDRKLMAWHEAGHAVVTRYSPEQEQISRISIMPSDKAFGVMETSSRRKYNTTRKSLTGNIAVALAGRISEEMFLHETSSSCIHDLNKARDIAIRMVATLGMGSRSGLLSCVNPVNNSFILLSEQQREDLFLDVKDIIDEARCNATKILECHKDEVEKLAKKLIERGTLHKSDFKVWLNRAVAVQANQGKG